jgi:hypothetical protein
MPAALTGVEAAALTDLEMGNPSPAGASSTGHSRIPCVSAGFMVTLPDPARADIVKENSNTSNNSQATVFR